MFKKILKKLIPRRYLPALSKVLIFLIRPIYLIIYSGSEYECPFCGRSFRKFLPAGSDVDIFREKQIIGGGYRLNSLCPNCRSADRERLVYLFIKKNELLYPQMKLLHIAPERNIQEILEKKEIDYFSADLDSPIARIKMDVRNINFPSDHFDMIICNHVLEHIIEDKKAIKELYRVLKPGGKAILQVPYSPILNETFEDFSITGEKEREEAFGQFDHVRIYGTDYVNRLQSAGFQVEQRKLDKNMIKNFALNSAEPIFFCKK